MFQLVRLLTTLLAFTLFAANSASAITASLVEKPASGLLGVLEHRVGINALASSGRVDEKLTSLYDFASDFPVAARGSTIAANRAAGEAFERQVVERLSNTQTGVVQQVTVRTSSGVRTRLDALGRDASGAIRCTECKSSATAPLTTNQAAAFPEIQQSGAIVVGRGKPGFPGGTEIPPTAVDIIRP